MRPIVWIGDSKEAVRKFPDEARREAGFQLNKIQNGEDPDDWKPMSTIGIGVREIRIRDRSGAFRVIYVARYANAIYVLHAFHKKTQATRRSDIELARERYQPLRDTL